MTDDAAGNGRDAHGNQQPRGAGRAYDMIGDDERSGALSMKPVVLAHVSDLHLPFEPALRPAQRLSKRQLSAWSWPALPWTPPLPARRSG